MKINFKDSKTIVWVVVAVVVLALIIKMAGGLENIFSAFNHATDSLGSKDSLDKQAAAADGQISQMSGAAKANGITISATALSNANAVYDKMNTQHTLDSFGHPFTSHGITEDDANAANAIFIQGKTGRSVAAVLLAYGTRKLPNRSGSFSGIFYDDTKGTLRDHIAKYYPDGALKTSTLAVVDKIINDYLS